MTKFRFYVGCFLSAAVLTVPVAGQAGIADVTIKVSFTAPPCLINNGQVISVAFGDDILTTKVDGVSYKRKSVLKKSDVVCAGVSNNSMVLSVRGDDAGFGSSNPALKTDKANLGIALFQGSSSTPLALNTPLPFTYPNIPELEAAPVKKADSKLTGGKFYASATLKVEYR